MEEGSDRSALKRQSVIRLAERDNLDEDDLIISNRMADESFAKAKDVGERERSLKDLAKKLTDSAGRNAKEPVSGE